MSVRTCSEICIDADNHPDDLAYLEGLWKEVVQHKYHYPLVQLYYIKEHIGGLVTEMARRDARMLREALSFLYDK